VHYVKKISRLVALLGFLLLAACSQAPVQQVTDTNGDFQTVATVQISPTDTEASLEAKYGGKVVLLNKKAGLAMLGFYGGDFTALATTTNQDTFGTPEVTAAGTSAWGGGQNAWGGGKNAWGGGWNAWGGGWKAWGGGTSTTALPALPSENRAAWRDIKLSQAQALSKNFGAGIKIAVIDTGIDLNHPMFSGRLAPSTEWKDFIDNDATPQEVAGSSYGHGTAVAGVILQAAPRATILPIRVLGGDGVGDTDDIAAAIDWAIQKGVKVINLSLGTDVQATAMQAWVGYALSQGIYVVTSAGNSGGSLTFPAAEATTMTYSGTNYSKYLISVGSVSSSGSRSGFSCYGTGLELMAPGEQVYTAFPDNQTGNATGTSFAAPQVAGVLALALGDTAAANRGNLQSYLTQSSYLMGTGNGSGLINAVGFMNRLPDVTRRQALFVVDFQGTNALLIGDTVFKTRLESIGYTVTVKDQDVLVNTDTNGKDVIVVSSSVDGGTFAARFRDSALPVVTWEEDIFEDMRFNATPEVTNNWASGTTETQVRMLNSTHPLAAGYTGDVPVFQGANQMPWSKQMASGAIKIASTTFDSSKTSIFGFDKGAQMVGMTAPARRVGLFHNYYGTAHTTQGLNFLEAAVTWAVTGN
jgi:Subtilase family